jgi:plasmid maintenance system antidote protein VapI
MGNQTVQLLDTLSASLGDASDYAVAKALGVTRATVSKWRTGVGAMSDETAIRAAKILNQDPSTLILIMAEDRARTPTVKAFYRQIADRLRAALPAKPSLDAVPRSRRRL